MEERILEFIRSLEKKHEDKTILIVTHSSPVRAVICWFKRIDFSKHLMLPILNHYVGEFILDKGKLTSYNRL